MACNNRNHYFLRSIGSPNFQDRDTSISESSPSQISCNSSARSQVSAHSRLSAGTIRNDFDQFRCSRPSTYNRQQNQDSFSASPPGGFVNKYGPTIVTIIVAAILTAFVKKYGWTLKVNTESYETDYVRKQMNNVKMSIAQLHVAHQELEHIYAQTHEIVGHLQNLTKEIGNTTEPCTQANSNIDEKEDNSTVSIDIAKTSTRKDEINVDELVDYALESSGAYIIATPNTINYRKANEISFLGITICYKEMGPELILQPLIIPGNCWAFKGPSGNVLIQLPEAIMVTGITLDHISNDVFLMELDSAPREFSVYGSKKDSPEDDSKSKLFYGRFVYDSHSTPTQYFPVQEGTYPIDVVEVVIHLNYGNMEYTCLYKIRIHGTSFKIDSATES